MTFELIQSLQTPKWDQEFGAGAAMSAAAASASAAELARVASEDARDLAQLAALTAPKVYPDTVSGLAAVGEGDTFWVQGADAPELYREVAGAAVLLGSMITVARLGAPTGITLVGGSIRPAPTRADVASISGAAHKVALLHEAAREGVFIFKTAAEYAAETGRTLAGDIAGGAPDGLVIADGDDAWVRRLSSTLSIKQVFGAKGNGSTVDQPAVDAAIRWANFIGGTGSSGMETENITIELDDGAYNCPTGLTERITKDNITFSARGDAIIMFESGTVFKWGAEADATTPNSGGLNNITFMSTNPAAGALCVDMPNAVRQRFTNIKLRNVRKFAKLGSATKQAISVRFNNIDGWVFNSGEPTFELYNGAGFYLDGYSLYVQDVPVPTAYHNHAAIDGTNFIHCVNKWDTVVLGSGNCNRYDHSIYCSNDNNQPIINWKISQCFNDYSKRGAIFRVPATATSAALIDNIEILGGWFVGVALDSLSFVVEGSLGAIRTIKLGFSEANLSGRHGINFSCPAAPAAIKDVDVEVCTTLGNALGGTGAGLNIDGPGDIRIKGGGYGRTSSGVAPLIGQAVNGVNITSASRRFSVLGVGATGSDATNPDFLIANPAAGVTGCVVRNNQNMSGAKPSYATTVPPAVTVPASGVGYTNATPFQKTMYSYAGTVTATRLNGVNVAGAGPGSISLMPGDTWSAVYTAAPQLFEQILP